MEIENAITTKSKNRGPFFNDILTRKDDSDNTRVKSMIIDYKS